MTGNPFQYLRPVSPDAFIGRWDMVNEMADDLLNDRGDSHAIIAGRRCGKSSMLIALAHQIRALPENETTDWLALPLLLDFKSGEFESAGAIFSRILHDVRRRVDATARRRPPDAWPNPARLEADWFNALSASPSLSLVDFQDALGYILDQLDTPLQRVRLILLLDEMDETVGRPWTAALYNQLRSLVYSGELKEQVRLVLTGSSRFLDAMNDRGSPLWNILQLHYLQSFNQSETDQLISQAQGLGQEAAQAVWQQGGGHPFLTQYLLYYLWESGFADANAATVEHLAARFQHERLPDLEGWTYAIEPIGVHVHQILSAASAWVEESDILRAVNEPSSQVKRGLIALCYHGLATHDGTWERFKRTAVLFTVPDTSPPSPSKPIVFLSYSHADEAEKDRLVTHLSVLEQIGLLELWVDDHVQGGADWEAAIKEAMARTRVAILLISANFLTSNFILREEVPGFLERRQRDGIMIFPVIAKPCAWQRVEWLAKMNVRPKNGAPIWDGEHSLSDGALAIITDEIAALVEQR